MNLVKWSCSPRVLVAQWIERLPGCLGGHGFNSRRGLRFFFVPCLRHVEYFILHKKCLCNFLINVTISIQNKTHLFSSWSEEISELFSITYHKMFLKLQFFRNLLHFLFSFNPFSQFFIAPVPLLFESL